MKTEIKNQENAKNIWITFNKKYSNFSEGITPENRSHYLKNPSPTIQRENKRSLNKDEIKEINKTLISGTWNDSLFIDPTAPKKLGQHFSATLIQRKWRSITGKDTLIPVNYRGNHSGDFNNLTNKQAIKRSFNKEKIDTLLRAITLCNWNDPIFNDPTLPQIAMSLFASAKISQQQIYSILERHQTICDFPETATYKILDDHGNFTEKAQEHLIPILKNRTVLNNLSEEQIEKFRLLISTLPPSERIFYTTTKISNSTKGGSLIELFTETDSIYHEENDFLHLSCGARDALGLTCFGEEEYVRLMPRLGVQTISDIEDGVRRHARYAALEYPEVPRYSEIHGTTEFFSLEAISHDLYHANVMSTIPKNIIRAMWRLVDIVRTNTGEKWSKEIWSWIDCDFPFTLENHKSLGSDFHPSKMTELFCSILLHGDYYKETSDSDLGNYLIEADRHIPSDETTPKTKTWSLTIHGAMIYLDMIKNKQAWLALHINPENLSDPLKEHYLAVKEIFPYVKENSSKIQLFKCLLYAQLKKTNQTNKFLSLSNLINKNTPSIEKDIVFKKINNHDINALLLVRSKKNTLLLTYKGKPAALPSTLPNLLATYDPDYDFPELHKDEESSRYTAHKKMAVFEEKRTGNSKDVKEEEEVFLDESNDAWNENGKDCW